MASSSLAFPAILFAFFLLIGSPVSAADNDGCFIKEIYNFGDSISDTGNLIRQGTGRAFATIANLPYGETIKKATGRCSDGYLMIDYLATSLNLPRLNPYLDKKADFKHGVNFAVAGATALDSSFFKSKGIGLPFTNNSLDVQLDWFHNHLKSICPSNKDCDTKLERSLFMVGEIGGNDYNYAFFEGKSIDEVKTFVPLVVQNIMDVAQNVIDTGARYVIVPGNFPIGCMPSYLTTLGRPDSVYDFDNCLVDFNYFALYHNEKLQEALMDLRHANPNVLIMYADYFSAFMQILHKSLFYGFNVDTLLQACCGAGGDYNFNGLKMCGAPGTSVCDNPGDHISWDGVHLTQAAYKLMATALMKEGFTHPSIGSLMKC